MSGDTVVSVCLPALSQAVMVSLKVSKDDRVRKGTTLCVYQLLSEGTTQTLKSPVMGIVRDVMVNEEEHISSGDCIMKIERNCDHSMVAFDLCAICGVNIKSINTQYVEDTVESASVSMLHSVPEVKVTHQEAQRLGNIDKQSLLYSRKLALIVDLDQTLVHTSVDPNIQRGLPDVYGFKLAGHPCMYHCRLRPYVREFLTSISSLYELHVFTMGTRDYALSITKILDKKKKLFSDRVISRNDFFDPHSKALRLKSVFPCGDEMVAIIDDREDVWDATPNLVHVKPYVFFAGTADINAPPTLNKSTPSQDLVKQVGGVNKNENNNNGNGEEGGGGNGNNGNGSHGNAEAAGNDGHENSQGGNGNHGNSNHGDGNHGNDDQSQQTVSTEGDNSSTSADSSSDSDSTSSDSSDEEDNKNNTGTSMEVELTKPSNKTETTAPEAVNKTDNSKDGHKASPNIVDRDDFLLHLTDILTRIHNMFYTEYDIMCKQVGGSSHGESTTPDLKEIIPRLRKSVLKGARLLFTGVIPTNIKIERSREWNTARAFGAVVHANIVLRSDEPTTHVIVGRKDTAKYKQAKRVKGIKIVNPNWFWCCAERWKLVNESLFPVEDNEIVIKPQSKATVRQTPVVAEEKGKDVSQEKNESRISNSVPSTSTSSGGERKFSVSREELEMMEAEIEAELEDDDDDDEEEQEELGSLIQPVTEEYERKRNSFNAYLGLEEPGTLSRKRPRTEDNDISSDSDSTTTSSDNDELAKLLDMT